MASQKSGTWKGIEAELKKLGFKPQEMRRIRKMLKSFRETLLSKEIKEQVETVLQKLTPTASLVAVQGCADTFWKQFEQLLNSLDKTPRPRSKKKQTQKKN
jgi:hypothetical protein